jgi:hypothetical protein
MNDPFKGKRGRQKGQTKDIIIIKDPIFAPYEIHEDKNCYTLMEPGYNDNMMAIGYYNSLEALITKLVRGKMVDNKGTFTLREYVKEHKQTLENFKQALNI